MVENDELFNYLNLTCYMVETEMEVFFLEK